MELLEPSVIRQRKLLGFPLVDTDIAVGANINTDKIGTGIVSNTEFDFLNGVTSSIQTQLDGKELSLGFTPEDSVNKGAISGYAGLDATQKLLLINFPSGTALQVLRRNAGNTALEFADSGAAAGITTINGDATAAQIIAVGIGLDIIDAGATHTLSIDNTVVTLTDVQTLTNKIITAAANTITIASSDLTDTADIARNLNDLSFFAATTSAQLATVISDKTGVGLLVFQTSAVLLNPTIANFANAIHDHADVGGGGQLSNTAIVAAAGIEYSKLNLAASIEDSDMSVSGDAMLTNIEFVIDGGGSVITPGIKGYLEIGFNCIIEQVTLLADQTGSIVIDVWKDFFVNYPPSDADSITAAAVPTISSDTNSRDQLLVGWTTTIAAGDIVGFNVDSVTTHQRVTISILCRKI